MSLLSVTRRGTGPPLVWLHGFTQTRDSAQRFRTILAETFELWTLDLPGHGTASGVTASLVEAAQLIVDVLPEGPVSLGGYSLGGRVALHVALGHPERVSRLVVVSATRGIRDDAERAERRRRDDILAEHILQVGTTTFLDEWLAQPLFSTLPHDAVERAARSSDAAGLATSLRTMGTGTQTWLGDRLAESSVPTLAVAGALDAKFSAEARAIADTSAAGATLIDGAGHAAHVEAPARSADLVKDFLT
jgi:2-succinyl-6-hydroxy-2,4-cyclohexadiene-1-carboxylate synthase